jgi:hypothetical protein
MPILRMQETAEVNAGPALSRSSNSPVEAEGFLVNPTCACGVTASDYEKKSSTDTLAEDHTLVG